MLYIKKISSVTQNELAAVGYAASDLALLAASLPVASSFVVLSTAFDETIRVNGLKYKIDYMLTHVQQNIPSTLVNAYNGVRRAMLETKFPNGFETELREMYESITQPLAVGDLVAANDRAPVRIIVSTNRLGDPENNDTIIQNVNGYDELLLAVREAWALAYHPSALGARMRERFPESRFKIALIVQVMDRPAATVHAYSCLPQDHHKVYLQAYAGYPDLRERIAKDYYAIGKEGLQVIAVQKAGQQELLDRNERNELVPLQLRSRFELLDRDVQEIARLCRKSERVLQQPVKCFFTIQGDAYELLWANRLGFDIIIKGEESPQPAPQSAPQFAPQFASHPVSPIFHPREEQVPAQQPEPAASFSPEPLSAASPVVPPLVSCAPEVSPAPGSSASEPCVQPEPSAPEPCAPEPSMSGPSASALPEPASQPLLVAEPAGAQVTVCAPVASQLAPQPTSRSVQPVLESEPSQSDFIAPADPPVHADAQPAAGPLLQASLQASPLQSSVEPATPTPAQPAPVDVQTGVAAKLLNASLRIVRQVVERKYRGAFGETNTAENLAEAINRLNQASVFSRSVDGVLLLKAEEAAKNESRLSESEYAKAIEEVAFLMTYA
jgi:phosphoenolpyruvate synthase/pyruvate phosphate dikinase